MTSQDTKKIYLKKKFTKMKYECELLRSVNIVDLRMTSKSEPVNTGQYEDDLKPSKHWLV